MGVITLKKGKAGAVWAGHPWVFAGAIESHDDDGRDLVEVRDDRGKSIGHGLLSRASTIRVRMIDAELVDGQLGEDALAVHLAAAKARRGRLGLPDDRTDVYRLHNSEGDGMGGLTVDCVGPELVVFQLTTAPLTFRRDALVLALARTFGDVAILEVPASSRIAELEGFRPEGGWHTPHQPETVRIRENDVAFEVRTSEFQKTGHYADMRPHREWVQKLSPDQRVFDGYCYTGAFGLYAARAGASRVVCVDSSAAAIEAAARNAELNGVEIDFRTAKVDDALRSLADRGEAFDLLVLDPPKLAPSRKHVGKALKVYESLAVQAARVAAPGAVLCLGSCSEAIGLAELERVVSSIHSRLRRPCRIVHSGTQGGDHPYPAAMSEGRYLTFVAAELA